MSCLDGIVRPFTRNGHPQQSPQRYTATDQVTYVTTDYELLAHDTVNRGRDDIDELAYSIKVNGTLREFPLVVNPKPLPDGRFKIEEGHGRYVEARKAKEPIYFVFKTSDYDINVVNAAQKSHATTNYLDRHVSQGKAVFIEADEFAQQHGVDTRRALMLLSGFNVKGNDVKYGTVVIKPSKRGRACAARAATIFNRIIAIESTFDRDMFLKACYAVSLLNHINADRLAAKAETKVGRKKLLSNTDFRQYLLMLEAVYNVGTSSNKVAFALDAITAFKSRK